LVRSSNQFAIVSLLILQAMHMTTMQCSGSGSTRAAGVKLAGLGTLLNTSSSGATTASIGNTGIASLTLSLIGAGRKGGTIGVTCAHSSGASHFLETVAITVLIDATIRKGRATSTWVVAAMFLCALRERLPWQPGCQRRPGYDPRNTPNCLSPPQLLIG
jgi:hypothetical protein